MGDLWEINCWMAQNQQREFQQWQDAQQCIQERAEHTMSEAIHYQDTIPGGCHWSMVLKKGIDAAPGG